MKTPKDPVLVDSTGQPIPSVVDGLVMRWPTPTLGALLGNPRERWKAQYRRERMRRNRSVERFLRPVFGRIFGCVVLRSSDIKPTTPPSPPTED